MDGRRLLHGPDVHGVAAPAANDETAAGQRGWGRDSARRVRGNSVGARDIPRLGTDRVFDRRILDAGAARTGGTGPAVRGVAAQIRLPVSANSAGRSADTQASCRAGVSPLLSDGAGIVCDRLAERWRQ